jgi:hypothetical protein
MLLYCVNFLAQFDFKAIHAAELGGGCQALGCSTWVVGWFDVTEDCAATPQTPLIGSAVVATSALGTWWLSAWWVRRPALVRGSGAGWFRRGGARFAAR